MYVVPEVDEVVAIADRLGIHLGTEEAQLYRTHLAKQLRAYDEFVQTPVAAEDVPPVTFAARDPGRRPTLEEDPLGAWLWRCEISGSDEGVLAGKTVSYKDHVAVAGIPVTLGAFALDGLVADFDATVVTRALAEGATITGKNTMNGLTGGFGLGGEIGDYRRPRNPHAPDHLPGGSSSGSAVAVATGEVDISFGGDQGGSIRIPAAWSGTVGLKPTFGLVSHFGIGFGSDQSIDFTGPMTRTVEDAAAALQAVAGYDGLDPRQGRDVPDAVDALSTLADGVAGLKVAVVDEGFVDADPDVRDLVMAAVDVLALAGAEVTKVSIPEHLAVPVPAGALMAEGARAVFDTGFFGAFTKTYYPESLIAAVNRLWFDQADLLNPRTKFGFILAELSRRTFHGRVYAHAQNVRPSFVRAYDAALAEADVLVMPTSIMKAPRFEAPESLLEDIEANITLLSTGIARNTQPFNYTGHPALAVPVGKAGGLPVSMQLVGKRFDDPLLLRAAYAYEQSVDWDETIAVGAG